MATCPVSINVPSHEGVLDITESCGFQHWSYCLETHDAATSVVWKHAWVAMRLDDEFYPRKMEYMLYLAMVDPEGRERIIPLGTLTSFMENAAKAIRYVHGLSRS